MSNSNKNPVLLPDHGEFRPKSLSSKEVFVQSISGKEFFGQGFSAKVIRPKVFGQNWTKYSKNMDKKIKILL